MCSHFVITIFVCLTPNFSFAMREFGPQMANITYDLPQLFSNGHGDAYYSSLYENYRNAATALDNQPCGESSEAENRVINGIFTQKGKFPWLVSWN